MNAKPLTKAKVLRQIVARARRHYGSDAGGHDWHHIRRVWKMARRLARVEGADLFVVELAALLHDVADWKDSGDLRASARVSRLWLNNLGVDEPTIRHVEQIVTNVSFKGAGVQDKMKTLEGKVV